MVEEVTQQIAPEHVVPVGEASFNEQDGLAVLVGTAGINCAWVLDARQDGLSWTFGRGEKAHFRFPSDRRRLSSVHFRVWATTDQPPTIMMQDLSTNGTFLNNVRIPKGRNCMLVNGDLITVGLGVAHDEIKLIVSIPKTSKATPQGGVYDLYDFGELVGQGAFALVRQAVKRETGEKVAVKIIDKSKITGTLENAVEREIEILKQLKHPNIVALHDIFVDHKHYYLVMDYVPHGDLMDFLLNAQAPDSPGLPEAMCQQIVKQVLEAVAYVHSVGISHRDLKPDNILINTFDPVSVKVADFGLAKLQAQGTFLKTFCGTLSYLAPEVLGTRYAGGAPRPAVYTRLVDVWSVGCLTYVILTGCMPFGGDKQEDLYRSVIAGEYYEAPLANAHVSDEARAFVRYLLTVDIETRPQAAQALQHPWLAFDTQTLPSQDSQQLLSGRSVLSNKSNRSMMRSNIPGLADLKLKSEWRPSRLISEISSVEPSDGPGALDTAASRPSIGNSVFAGDVPAPDIASSDSDGDETRQKVDAIASQHREPAQRADPRDFGDVEDDVVPPRAWGQLETTPDSVPCKDLFLVSNTFRIGRLHPRDRRHEYAGPPLDFTHEDMRLSRVHCTLSRERGADGKFRVYVYAYNLMYVNTIMLKEHQRTQAFDGDRICLFAEKQPSGKTSKLMFVLQLLHPEEYAEFKRPKALKRVDPIAPDSQFALAGNFKRQRSEELVPSSKRMTRLENA